jgi:O86/O127-antigen biosynthesis alpha-1,2-fucosyltransferase
MMSQHQIVVRLIGGLGNQLFQIQYAIGLQEKIGGTIQIDDSFLASSAKAHENLAVAGLNFPYEIIRLEWLDLKVKRVVEKVFYKLGFPLPKPYHPVFLFENCLSNSEEMQRIIIDGFWQDSSYLRQSFVNTIRERMKNFMPKNHQMDNIICVHIRRGDYLTNKHWGIRQQTPASLDYYLQAFNFFEKEMKNPIFEIYTDDEYWVSKTFSTKANVKVVKSSKLSPLKLLATMSTYRNYIIANSTLSWWAAVLSNNIEKKVVMPSKWGVKQNSNKFRLPTWVILPS